MVAKRRGDEQSYSALLRERNRLADDLRRSTQLAADLAREDQRKKNEELVAGLAREVVRLQVQRERARRALRNDRTRHRPPRGSK